MLTSRGGPVAFDLQALQSPMSRGRGIGRYTEQLALAIEAYDPDLVGAYLLNPRFGPPAANEALVASGKLTYATHLPGHCRVLHLSSPFDTEVPLHELWRDDCDDRSVALSATVYDLIPLVEPSAEMTDPVERRRYRTRLELLRAADDLQVLSAAVARQLVEHAGIDARRVSVVGAAPDRRFVPPALREEARGRAISRLRDAGLSGPFVFAPSGSHPRKNNERLIEAFAVAHRGARPAQLLLSAEVDAPTANHYRHLARELGVADALVHVNYLDDETMLDCYQGAELVCVASLAEGYGLPVAEALACGTLVIGSDRPPIDELLPGPLRFDPTDTEAMAAAIAAALDAPTAPPLPAEGWEAVAERSVSALRELAERPARRQRPTRSGRRSRPRLALVTPLPPAPTGVAGYSLRLLEALLASEKVRVDVFVDGGGDGLTPAGVDSYPVAALERVEALRGRYDDVVYCLGNSHHHLDALSLLSRRPGVVIAHDVRLSNLYRHAHGDPAFYPGGLTAALHAMYPDLPAEAGEHVELPRVLLDRYGVLMARDVIHASRGFLVSSSAAAALAATDALPDDVEKIAVLPFAIGEVERREGLFAEAATPVPDELGAPGAHWGRSPVGARRVRLISTFGIVDPAKEPALLVRAFAAVHDSIPEARLAFVGPIAESLARELVALATGLGVDAAIAMTGPLDAATYRSWVNRTDLAVQLRASFNGEASAAVGECLAHGLPTVVTRSGWARDLPDFAVDFVERDCSPDELSRVVVELLQDPRRTSGLAAGAREVARERTFALSARALLSYLERLPAPIAAH